MGSLGRGGRAGVVGAFGSASGCLGGLLGVGSPCFGGVVDRVCPPGLRLGGAGVSDTGAPFLDLHLSVAGGFVSSGVCGGRDGFGFGVVSFPFLDGGVPRRASCGVCVSRLVGFAGVCGRVAGFGARGGCLTARLLQRGCRCHKLRKTFSEFYCRHCGLVSGCSVGLGALLGGGLSEPGFCGGLVYRLRRLVGVNGFSLQFGEVMARYRRIGCGLGVVRRSACLVFGPVMVGGCAAFFGCAPVGRASGSVVAPTWGCSFWLVGAGASCLLLGPPGSGWCFSFAPGLVGCSAPGDLHRRAAYSICGSWFLVHRDVCHDLFVCSWWFID